LYHFHGVIQVFRNWEWICDRAIFPFEMMHRGVEAHVGMSSTHPALDCNYALDARESESVQSPLFLSLKHSCMSRSLLQLTTSVGGCDLVRFGIFSHSLDEAKGLKGFRKIQYCADLASKDGRVLVLGGHLLH
jgi:hypothetical protein